MTTKEFADSLRMLADFYNSHPDMELPYDPMVRVFPEGRIGMAKAAKAMGSCEKHIEAAPMGFYQLIRKFGVITLSASEFTDKVCTAKVVGERVVPAKVIPQYIEPEHTEKILEWECTEPLLLKST